MHCGAAAYRCLDVNGSKHIISRGLTAYILVCTWKLANVIGDPPLATIPQVSLFCISGFFYSPRIIWWHRDRIVARASKNTEVEDLAWHMYHRLIVCSKWQPENKEVRTGTME